MTNWIHFSVTDATLMHATLHGVQDKDYIGLTVSGPETREVWCTSENRKMTLAELAEMVRQGHHPRVRELLE